MDNKILENAKQSVTGGQPYKVMTNFEDFFAKKSNQEEFDQEEFEGGEINENMQELRERLIKNGYVPNEQILYALQTAMTLKMPILVEGETGVGKSSFAKALSQALGLGFIKIQFYKGISNNEILYEYDYAKQMLYMNAIRDNIKQDLDGLTPNEALLKLTNEGIDFFGKEFLIERPLLKSISGEKSVLLMDEIDKTDEETEFSLLEILDTYSITIPEYGTVKCDPDNIPLVILTSNNTRELSKALKRRCVYLYINQKTLEESCQIIMQKAHVSEKFARATAKKIQELRNLDLKQKPTISDSINWAISLINSIGESAFEDKMALRNTIGVVLKNQSDIEKAERMRVI